MTKRYRVFKSETSFYYSICTITDWFLVFLEERYFELIIDSLKYCQQYKGLFLLGYVIMPIHVHLITSNAHKTCLSEIMRDFRYYSSKTIRQLLELDQRYHFLKIFEKAAQNLSRQKYKLWKDDLPPIGLTSEKWFIQNLAYMHANPVRKGFVDDSEHWKFSSASNWDLDDNRIIRIDQDVLTSED